MTEPASAAITAGLGAMVMATLGVEPQPLFWALFGASLGLSAAAEAGKVRALAVFAAVVLCCGLFGTWVSVNYFGGDYLTRNATACVLAIFFHPLLNASVAKLPQAIDAVCRKLGIT